MTTTTAGVTITNTAKGFKQAIVTKYLGPTNHNQAKIKATCEGGSLTLKRDYDLNIDIDHARVAQALATKLGWTGEMVGGGMPGAGYAFVFVD